LRTLENVFYSATTEIKCRNETSNYRPISLLSLLSKLIERHLHSLITEHFTEARQLSNNQWGFQAGKSTTTALLSVVNEWYQMLEHGGDIGAIFLI